MKKLLYVLLALTMVLVILPAGVLPVLAAQNGNCSNSVSDSKIATLDDLRKEYDRLSMQIKKSEKKLKNISAAKRRCFKLDLGQKRNPPKLAFRVIVNKNLCKKSTCILKANKSKLTWPVPYPDSYIAAAYGKTPGGGVHRGIDICVSGGSNGKKIAAAQGGTIISAGWVAGYGNCIIIDHGNGLLTLYAHCKSMTISKGDKVKKGKIIGFVGTTGNTTGPNLHFEVRKNVGGKIMRVNPLDYVSMP